MTDLMNESINDEAVYKTAPAAPGMSKSKTKVNQRFTLQNLLYFSLKFVPLELQDVWPDKFCQA